MDYIRSGKIVSESCTSEPGSYKWIFFELTCCLILLLGANL